ncbi:hypothetical protein GQ43DRAFT_382677 [Delitschia confertaspora ATCC 74209]|uniref:Chromatin remodelling complex Rsc7/Swp82 subunit n=1 Tax=Delitschia confertaspora ATCC 74209 TaxID=1513339 RepID=A0A9P4MU30_9PLEO|nr:hypothetical protein GQ43DRAFT_382677 [Delitschia confertaspora ATCC 74209]
MPNGGIGNGMVDGQGTINPAALNSQGPPSAVASQSTPRGIKRSRSPDNNYDVSHGDHDSKPRKRGRPPKSAKASGSPRSAHPHSSQTVAAPPVQTPQSKNISLPQTSPAQPSPSKATPTKGTVIKALPTVRDHTTDQLTPEGDEYIPREIDEAGEKKVTLTGHPLDGREYRCKTFFVQGRGDKLFMLATECARALGYRDSYLLFNKNRSLYKIICTQAEKDDLIAQDALPFAYRSRQIAIVTARSMFRQFGSRVIVNGRRVRDDYWESKARKQGFTEEDAAGEKRPGAAKAREAAALAATPASNAYAGANRSQTIVQYAPAGDAPPQLNSNLPPREYMALNIQRPRQEITGPPYQDIIEGTPPTELANQAIIVSKFNNTLANQRIPRARYMDDYWRRPHEQPAESSPQQGGPEGEAVPAGSQAAVQSPHLSSSNTANVPQYQMPEALSQQRDTRPHEQMTHAQNPMVQSPMRPAHAGLRPDQLHARSPSMGGMAVAGAHGQPAGYGYGQGNMWTGQPQPSPLSQQHNMQQYAQHPAAHASPHPQQSPLHAPPQLHHSQSSGPMHGQPMPQYQTMGAMANPGYPSMGRNPYQQSPNPQQYMQSTAAQQPGMPGWAPGPPQPPQPGWGQY